MEKKKFSLCCAVLLAILAIHTDLSSGQDRASTQQEKLPDKILEFLKPEGEMRKHRATFTGVVVPIPENLKESLKWLYLHRFTIVQMKISFDISSMTTELIVVTDAKSGEVISYVWQSQAGESESFKQLLASYPKYTGTWGTDNLKFVLIMVKALADLLVYPDRNYERGIESRVGSISVRQKGKIYEISAELIRSYIPYRLLTLQMEETELKDRNLEYKYGSLSITDPASKELR